MQNSFSPKTVIFSQTTWSVAVPGGKKLCKNSLMKKKKHENNSLGHASASARFEVSWVVNFNLKTISDCENTNALCAEVVYVKEERKREKRTKIINASCEFFSHQSFGDLFVFAFEAEMRLSFAYSISYAWMTVTAACRSRSKQETYMKHSFASQCVDNSKKNDDVFAWKLRKFIFIFIISFNLSKDTNFSSSFLTL